MQQYNRQFLIPGRAISAILLVGYHPANMHHICKAKKSLLALIKNLTWVTKVEG